MTTTGKHPAPFTDSIIDELAKIIPNSVPSGWTILDPFAGEGHKLGALCDRLGYEFVGNDIEVWPGADPRVRLMDSTNTYSYPWESHAVVTSPTYNNGVNDHFEPKDNSQRLTYRSRLGRALHVNNTGRYTGRGSKRGEKEYWRLTNACVRWWPNVSIVNVKDSIRKDEVYPFTELWTKLLYEYGYDVEQVDVECPGWRYGSNNDARLDTEAILIGVRS